MKRTRALLLAACALVLLLPAQATFGAAPLIVDGLNDQAVDRQAIQDAIDQAAAGGTVELRGTFQLDGQTVFIDKELRLRGEALDDDGDGAANEDWADGVDNDGDGAIDEDDWNTVLHGLVDANGQPLGDLPDGTLFNRGFSMEGLSGEVEDIEIRDILFLGLNRAVSALPDLENLGVAFACSDLVATGGSLENARIRRNRFANNGRSIQFFGAVEESEIKENVVLGGGAAQVLLIGAAVGCTGGSLPIGRPTDIDIKGNRIQALGSSGFISSETIDTQVKGNTFIGGSFAVSINDDERADVSGNTITGSSFPIIVFQSVGPARIVGNQLSGHTFGILLDTASGYDIKDNVFLTAGFVADVFLDVTTSNNRVVVPAGTLVTDLGVDNEVIFE